LFACRSPQVLTAQNAWYFTDNVRQFRRDHCPAPMRARLALEAAAARQSIRRATLVATVSRSMRTAIERDLGPLNHLHVLTSAAPRLPAAGVPPLGLPKDPYALVIAHDDPHKEWDRLIHAFSTGPALPPLVIAGRARRDRPPRPRIHMVGEVADRAAIAALYERCACYVAHSHVESFGLTPAEALSAGIPVAASDIPAHREVCGVAAHYYAPLDLQALRAAVASALDEGRREPIPLPRTWHDNARELAGLLRMAAHQSNSKN
jgi:glycosyltransferase involved in cell wall biosynthesis